MRVRALIDTGAVLALLDKSDRWHTECVRCFGLFHLPLVSSAAVLTELFHLLDPHEIQAAWALLRSGAVTVAPLGDDDVPVLQALMQKYSDRPMDFADASLVCLARREALNTVFTVDFADFQTYRIEGRKQFRIYPNLSA